MQSYPPLEAPPEETASAREAPRETIGSEPEVPARARKALRVLGQRRRFLIDPRSQLRAAVLTTGITLILLVLLNLSLHASRQQATATAVANAPEVESLLRSQGRLEFTLVLAASVVFLAGVFVITILETHKTAGAAFNIARHMEEVRHGQYNTRIRLRQDDNLQPLQLVFNEMTRTLQERAHRDAQQLEACAQRAEVLAGEDEARELARGLRAQAGDRRRLAD